MGYQKALEAAGAEVKEYKEFGSYQGTWMALLHDGRVVEGSYGSCSVCDAYEADFGYSNEIINEHEGKYFRDNHYWDEDDQITKEEADTINNGIAEKLKSFGQVYLNSSESFDDIIKRYKIKIDDEYAWDDDKEIYEWLLLKSTSV